MCVEKRRNKVGRALLLATAGIMAAGLLASRLSAQSFVVSQNGKSVGSANMSLRQTGVGVMVDSKTKIDMPGLKYDFSENAQMDGAYRLQTVKLDGSVNGTSAKVDTRIQGQQFLMHIDANGQQINTPLALHQWSVFMPDFDPAGLQALLNIGAARNNRDMWALVPKQSGSITPLQIVTQADMQGTLGTLPITVHHFTVNYDSTKTEVFSSPRNELLQAEWTDEGFALVRKDFKLTPAARPATPPPAAPPAGQVPAQPQQQ